MKLVVASDQFVNGKLGSAYGDVLRIAKEMKDSWFQPFRVKLVGLSEPRVQAALEFYYPGMKEAHVGRIFNPSSCGRIEKSVLQCFVPG